MTGCSKLGYLLIYMVKLAGLGLVGKLAVCINRKSYAACLDGLLVRF